MAEDQSKDAAGAESHGEAGGIKEKCDALNNLYDQMNSARRVNRWIRLAIILLILVTILGQVWRGWNVVDSIDHEEVALAFTPQIELISSTAMREVRRMSERLIPVYREEFKRQFDAEWPAMRSALMQEAETLRDKIAEEIPVVIRGRLDEMAQRQEERIREAFEIEDDEHLGRVIDNLQLALSGAFLEVSEERIEGAAVRMRATNELLVNFLPEYRREGFQDRIEASWDLLSMQVGEVLPEGALPEELD